MFKIEIKANDGLELKMSKNHFICYRNAGGRDSFWEWEHIAGKAEEFDPLFTPPRTLSDQAEKYLPDIPMPGLR